MKKNLLALACLSLLSFYGCNNPEENQQTPDGNSDIQDSSTDKQDNNSDKDDNNANQDDTDTTEDTDFFKEGAPCYNIFPTCADSNNLLTCTYDESTESFHWKKQPCEPNTFCTIDNLSLNPFPEYEGSCVPSCDPNSFSKLSCTTYDKTDRYYTMKGTGCVESDGRFIEKQIDRHCSQCLDDNNCIIEDSDLGLNAKQGNSCHYGLFKNRCGSDNNIIMCAKNSEKSAKVIEIKCEDDEICVIDPTINKDDYLPADKIYCKKKSQQCSKDTHKNSKEWHINYNDKTCIEVEINEYCISGSIYKKFTAYLSNNNSNSDYYIEECLFDAETCYQKYYCHLNSNVFTLDNF